MEVLEAINKLQELADNAKDHVQKVKSVTENADGMENGISLLRAKSATLMHYNASLIQFALARLLGKPVQPVVDRLVEDWVILTKTAPLEKKLQYQIDTLLKTASQNAANENEADRHRPDPDAVVLDDEEQTGSSDEERPYRAPRFSEVVYDGDDEKRMERLQKQKERHQARAIRSSEVQEMLATIQGRPEELFDNENLHTRSAKRLMKEQKQREQFEEDNFVRLSQSKKSKKQTRREMGDAMAGAQGGGNGFSGLAALADRVVHSTKGNSGAKGKAGGSKRSQRYEIDEEEEIQKERQLDQIVEEEERQSKRSSRPRGSARKRRRR
ncbi:Sas10 protein [Gracilaria domingensis]|nr:Sas10 protein [Gracilaria domingensis]